MNLPTIVQADVDAVKALTNEQRDNLASTINSTDPADIFEEAKPARTPDKRYIICPECGNGTGQHKTPVEVSFNGNVWLYHCFSCESFNGTLLKIIAARENLTMKGNFDDFCKALAVGSALIGQPFEVSAFRKPARKPADETEKKKRESAEIRKQIEYSQLHLADLPTSQMRGLTLDTYRHFHCGYHKNWAHPACIARGDDKLVYSRRVIIPTADLNHFNAVLLPADRNSSKTSNMAFKAMHAGYKGVPFNVADLYREDNLIVAVEGEYDAMTIWQISGGEIPVIATLGAGGWKRCLASFVDVLADKQFLILFDDDNAGNTNSQNLREFLLSNGIPAVSKFIPQFLSDADKERLGDKVDFNDLLTKCGADFAGDFLAKILADAKHDFADFSAQIKPCAAKETFPKRILEQCFYGDLTDRGNSARLARALNNRAKWNTYAENWLLFEGGKWREGSENTSAITPIVVAFADALEKAAKALPADDKEHKHFALTVSNTLHKSKKISAATFWLKGEENIIITTDDLNRHKHLLNVKNGVVDLQTGKLFPAEPELLLTQQANAIFKPFCRSDVVDNFLKEIMPDDETRAALLRWLGYCLTAETREQCALFAKGNGSNGKSTLFETLLFLLGDYGTTLSVKAIVDTGANCDPSAATAQLNVLRYARFALVDEFNNRDRLNESLFKTIAGGGKLPIRRLHHEQETIDILAKLNLNGNKLPQISDSNALSLKRRIRNIEFNQLFSVERGNLDLNLPAKLILPENISGFLSLLVQEAQNYYFDGLIESAQMKAAKTSYLDENDFITAFLQDNCVEVSTASIRKKDFEDKLKAAYPAETSANVIRPRDLSKRIQEVLASKGIQLIVDRKNCKFYSGIGWRSDDFDGEAVNANDLPPGF